VAVLSGILDGLIDTRVIGAVLAMAEGVTA